MKNTIHESYESRPASLSNAIDIFRDEWVSKLPGYEVGSIPLFQDSRTAWAIERAGGVCGKNILELGPLEGGHTYMLAKAGARSITSIEANSKCYLKCLITKELFGLNNVKILLGDFVSYVSNPIRFDYVQAAGILYHLVDPVEFLSNLCKISSQLYIWTHYVDLDVMPENDPRYIAGIVGVEKRSHNNFNYNAYQRRYLGSTKTDNTFCGGIYSSPLWLEKSTILYILKVNGFAVTVDHDMPNHPSGPCCSFFCQKNQ